MRDLHDTCLEVENSLPLWAGGDLEPDAQATVDGHLAVCERCSRSAVRARASRAVLHRAMQEQATGMGTGRDPWPAIRAGLRADGLVGGAGVPRQPHLVRPAFRRLSPAWPIAAALLVGLFLARTWMPSASSPARPPEAPLQADGIENTAAEPVQVAGEAAVPIRTLPASLQRVAPGEPRLRDSAMVFRANPPASPDQIGADETGTLIPRRDQVGGTPVSLERVKLLPPR